MTDNFYQMRRELARLEADCKAILDTHSDELKAIDALRPHNPTATPVSAPAPATEPKSKQWRFMNESGQIPESIVRKAVVDPNLLEAIAAEIEERSAQER